MRTIRITGVVDHRHLLPNPESWWVIHAYRWKRNSFTCLRGKGNFWLIAMSIDQVLLNHFIDDPRGRVCCPQKTKAAEKSKSPNWKEVDTGFLLLESEKTGSFSLLYAILLIKSRGGVDICTGDACCCPTSVNLRRQPGMP